MPKGIIKRHFETIAIAFLIKSEMFLKISISRQKLKAKELVFNLHCKQESHTKN